MHIIFKLNKLNKFVKFKIKISRSPSYFAVSLHIIFKLNKFVKFKIIIPRCLLCSALIELFLNFVALFNIFAASHKSQKEKKQQSK